MRTNPRSSPNQAPIKIITGQYLAKARHGYPPKARAKNAAEWVEGKIQIKPTVKLAASIFGTSVPSVVKALDEHRGLRTFPTHGGGDSTTLSDRVLDRIVRKVGPDRLQQALARVTAPELPLQQAAE